MEGFTCPFCGQDVSAERLGEIKGKYNEKLGQDMEARLQSEREALESRVKEQVEEARRNPSLEQEEELARLRGEIEAARGSSNQYEQAAAAREAEHEKAIAALRSELEAARGSSSQYEQAAAAREAEHEKAIAALRSELEAARGSGSAEQDSLITTLRADLDAVRRNNDQVAAQLQQARIEKDNMAAEREKMKKDFEEFRSKQDTRPAWQMGNDGERALLAILKEAFPRDRFETERKGHKEADIIQHVVEDGREIPTVICYDNKEGRTISTTDTAKAAAYKDVHGTTHVIIVAAKMPAGGNQGITRKNGILVVNQMLIAEVAAIIRDFVVRMEGARKAATGLDGKAESLYAYLAGEKFAGQMEIFAKIADDMAALQTQEERSHEAMWTKRKRMASDLSRCMSNHKAEIEAIMEGRLD